MFESIASSILELAKALIKASDRLAKVVRHRKSGQVFLCFTKEGYHGMKEFKLVLPLATARDVKFFEVVYKDGDADPVVLHPANADYGKDPETFGEIAGLQAENGTVITGSVCDIDDAGNKSEASEFSLTVSDTTAPTLLSSSILNGAINVSKERVRQIFAATVEKIKKSFKS
mgnify:CR=1 FL=1